MGETKDKETLAVELLDDGDLAALENRVGSVNLFEAAGLGQQEIRHSAFLRWVLDPESPHGLDDMPLRRLLARLFMMSEATDLAPIVVSDLTDAVVRTEVKTAGDKDRKGERRIDILVTSEKLRMVLCIENKTGSQLHDHQLAAYRRYLEREYPNSWKHLYVLLAPDGFVPAEDQIDGSGDWTILNYSDIAEVLEGLIPSTGEKTGSLIEDYVDLLKREGLMEDAQLDRLAINLYRHYRQVFDLVAAYRNGKDGENSADCLLAAGLYRMHGTAIDRSGERALHRAERPRGAFEGHLSEGAQRYEAERSPV